MVFSNSYIVCSFIILFTIMVEVVMMMRILSFESIFQVGPCESCVCQDGKIECFSSSANCPRVACDRPVLAKNQCCPICLGQFGIYDIQF